MKKIYGNRERENSYICFVGGRRCDRASVHLRHLQLKERANSAKNRKHKLVFNKYKKRKQQKGVKIRPTDGNKDGKTIATID